MEAPVYEISLAASTQIPLTDQGVLQRAPRCLAERPAPLRTYTNGPLLEKHLHKMRTG